MFFPCNMLQFGRASDNAWNTSVSWCCDSFVMSSWTLPCTFTLKWLKISFNLSYHVFSSSIKVFTNDGMSVKGMLRILTSKMAGGCFLLRYKLQHMRKQYTPYSLYQQQLHNTDSRTLLNLKNNFTRHSTTLKLNNATETKYTNATLYINSHHIRPSR